MGDFPARDARLGDQQTDRPDLIAIANANGILIYYAAEGQVFGKGAIGKLTSQFCLPARVVVCTVEQYGLFRAAVVPGIGDGIPLPNRGGLKRSVR
jgi:hypothetical protein